MKHISILAVALLAAFSAFGQGVSPVPVTQAQAVAGVLAFPYSMSPTNVAAAIAAGGGGSGGNAIYQWTNTFSYGLVTNQMTVTGGSSVPGNFTNSPIFTQIIGGIQDTQTTVFCPAWTNGNGYIIYQDDQNSHYFTLSANPPDFAAYSNNYWVFTSVPNTGSAVFASGASPYLNFYYPLVTNVVTYTNFNPANATSNIVYINATQGNDSTGLRGTSLYPFASIYVAQQFVQPGDYIKISEGNYTYTGQQWTLTNNVVTAFGATILEPASATFTAAGSFEWHGGSIYATNSVGPVFVTSCQSSNYFVLTDAKIKTTQGAVQGFQSTYAGATLLGTYPPYLTTTPTNKFIYRIINCDIQGSTYNLEGISPTLTNFSTWYIQNCYIHPAYSPNSGNTACYGVWGGGPDMYISGCVVTPVFTNATTIFNAGLISVGSTMYVSGTIVDERSAVAGVPLAGNPAAGAQILTNYIMSGVTTITTNGIYTMYSGTNTTGNFTGNGAGLTNISAANLLPMLIVNTNSIQQSNAVNTAGTTITNGNVYTSGNLYLPSGGSLYGGTGLALQAYNTSVTVFNPANFILSISAKTNTANPYAITNDPTPGAWNIGPNARFSVTVPGTVTQNATFSTAINIVVSNADWTTAGITKPQFSQWGATYGVGALIITNWVTTQVVAPNSLWVLTNATGVAQINQTLVDKL